MKCVNQKHLKNKNYFRIIDKLFEICNQILLYYEGINDEDIKKISLELIENQDVLSTQFTDYGFDKCALFKFDFKAFTFLKNINTIYDLYDFYGIGEICFFKNDIEYAEFSPCNNTPFYLLDCEELNGLF